MQVVTGRRAAVDAVLNFARLDNRVLAPSKMLLRRSTTTAPSGMRTPLRSMFAKRERSSPLVIVNSPAYDDLDHHAPSHHLRWSQSRA
jgi:hypothetical protein